MKKTLIIIGICALLILTSVGAFFLGRHSQKGKQENISAEKNTAADISEENDTPQAAEKQTEASPFPKPVTISASGENKGEITYTISASWGDEKTTYTQIDAVITNQSDQEVSNWRVSLTVPQGSKMNQSWNGKIKQKGTTLNITPEEYNAMIAAGQTANFGFIIETPSAYVPKESELILQTQKS